MSKLRHAPDNDPGIAAQSLLDSFKEFAAPQLTGYALGAALGAYVNEARAIYAGLRAASTDVAAADLAATQVALTQRVADARASLPNSIRYSGNMGGAEIDVPGVQPNMAASSQIDVPSPAQQAFGFVGKVSEAFPKKENQIFRRESIW